MHTLPPPHTFPYNSHMPEILLQTKLFVPRLRPSLVPRPHLIAKLNKGLHRKLTLIAAPAGFGKTTLVSEWIAGGERPFAWLSLDEGDADLTRFLTYFVAALRTMAAHVGERVLTMLQSPPLPPTESLLTTLLNDITTISQQFIFVLDDYHVVDTRSVDEALTFLLEHMPPQMHLVITTREDPNLPLARWRVRNQLNELRVNDLRFGMAETAEFLRQVTGLNVSEENIATLEARTEGWIAGLQLAALSMRGREDVPEFIRAFTGDNRYIVDYLVEEVLQRQPEPIRRFLLQTAILDRLNGLLCEAVTGQQESKAQLEALERGNFFIIPLDDRRHWYRYHHLFAEVLKVHLMAEQPDQVPALHRRASEWYLQNGSVVDAVRHALAAEDFERAADQVELAWPAMRRSREEATLLGWLQALPDELFQYRPVLSGMYAHVLLSSGKLEGVEKRLRDAERWLDATTEMRARRDTPAGAMVVLDDEEFRRLPGTVAIARAGLALARGDVLGTVTYAQRALDLAPEDDYLTRGGAAGFLGLAAWTSGDLEAADRTYAEGMVSLQRAGSISDAVNGAIILAAMRMAQGRLREAMRTYERGLQLATEQGGPALALRGTADMHVGMSEIHRERNDMQAATQHLLRSRELGEHTGFPQNRYRWYIAMARIREAQGDLDGALDLLDEAEHLYMSDFSPNVRPIAALKTRVWITQGRLDEALDWVRDQGLSVDDDLSYVREFEHMTLARVLLARYQGEERLLEILRLLDRLLKAAEEGERSRSVIEILVLQALARQMQGDIPAALTPLGQALTLAEPEGFVRIFLDEDEPMNLLIQDLRGKILDGSFSVSESQPMELLSYIDQLLQSFSSGQPAITHQQSPSVSTENLVEPLSQRELEVLRLFKTELSGPEIARELTIALSTVRTHTKSIFSKLDVTNRRAAVKRAEELNII